MDRRWAVGGAALAGLAVLLGAFGAHGLRSRVGPELLAVFDTAVRYQMYHALALLALGLAGKGPTGALLRTVPWLFAAGIALFSGSLYALALGGARTFGALTPLGGVAFVAGWASLAIGLAGRGGDGSGLADGPGPRCSASRAGRSDPSRP